MHVPARYRSAVTQAEHDEKTPVDADPATPDPAAEAPEDESPQDAARRKFREALERKNSTPGSHPGSQADGGSHLKSSNGKRKREFRRKSGG